MLTDDQQTDLWRSLIAAEVRSLYFADLASSYSSSKQWITGLSFFLSSGAAAALIAKTNVWFPILCSVFTAAMTAYAVAINLDQKTRTMSKLHYEWSGVSADYKRLWSHTYEETAEAEHADLIRRERVLSELASTDAPNNPQRIEKWENQVLATYEITSA